MGTFADYNGLQGNALFPMPPISNAPNEAANAPFPGISLDTSTGLNFGPETMGGIGLSEQPPPPAGVPLGQPPDVAGPALMSAPPPAAGRGFAGTFGDAATAFGLGLQGRNPMEAMNARAEIERRAKAQKLTEFNEYMKMMDFGVQKANSLSGADRGAFEATFGRQLEEIKPGLSETFKAMSKRPDLSHLVARYGASPTMQAAIAKDPSGRLAMSYLEKPEMHKIIESEVDSAVRPAIQRKLLLQWENMKKDLSPEDQKQYMVGGHVDTSALMRRNEELLNHPDQRYAALALNPHEMESWNRQHEAIANAVGMVSPVEAAKRREHLANSAVTDPNKITRTVFGGANGETPYNFRADGTYDIAQPRGAAAAPQPTAAPAASPAAAAGATVAPTVTAADIAAIPDPQERARAQAALDSGSVLNRPLALAPAAPAAFVPKVNARTQTLELSPEELISKGAQIAAGQPAAQVVSGYGGNVAQARNKAQTEAIRQIKAETGMDDRAAGEELSRRAIDRVAGGKSLGQLTTMLSTNRQAVDQLDFNVKKVSEEMAKLPSSDLSPIINAIYRGEEKWTGDPAYSSLYFYMHAAAQESARILSGGTASVAQLHAGAQAEAQKWANINMTPKVWNEGVAPAMLAEGKERLKTYERAISAQRGGRNSGAAGGDNKADGAWSVVR